MEQYYMVDIPFSSWILWGLALIGLIGLGIVWIFPTVDWKKEFFDIFRKFKEKIRFTSKKHSYDTVDTSLGQSTEEFVPESLWEMIVSYFSPQNKKTNSPGQLLCDYLNSKEVQEALEAEPENKRVSALRDFVNKFLTLHRHIPNGDVRNSVIDLNLDRHYRLRVEEKKWTVETEQTSR